MLAVLRALASFLPTLFRSRTSLQMEILALRHQLAVYQRQPHRPRLRTSNRLVWSWISRIWNRWQDALVIVQPRTVVAWQRRRFRDHWRRLSRPGRPPVSPEIRQAFPWDTAPRYLLRDRDSIYGATFLQTVRNLEIREVLTAHRCPWQNPYVERLIGSIRRDCLDHVIVFSEDHLRRILIEYLRYYHRWRTHRSLEMDVPDGRPVQGRELGDVIQMPEVGGLHHRYEREAA